MENLNLLQKLPSGRSWTEELPPGSHQRSSGTYASDSGQQTLNIKIAGSWKNVQRAIWMIVGYSDCVSTTTGLPFDPSNPAAQGPYILKRFPPATHPTLRGLRATKILSAQGVSLTKGFGAGGLNVGDGHVANWEFFYLSILFEIPRYAILSEDEMQSVIVSRGVEVGVNRRPEYLRYTEWKFDENVETLARKGTVWHACDPKAFAVTKTYAGDRFLRQPKGVLKVITYDMHQDYVLLGHIVATNSFRRNSTLNAMAFPQESYRDQNKASPSVVQFRPGTLLALPVKTTPRTQCYPKVLTDVLDPSYFPRTVDVERTFVLFDPVTDDGTLIDLSDAKYGPGSPITPVRGHQLAPLPSPSSTGFIWYAWRNKTANATAAAGDPANDRELLYEYSNFEALWGPVESLS